jgi:cell division protein FtsW
MNSPSPIEVNRVDYLLLVSVLFLVILGAAVVYSASSYKAEQLTGDSAYYFKNQLLRVVIGLVLMVFVASVDYRFWLHLAPVFLVIAFVLLLLLLTDLPIVEPIKGAKRWIRIGAFQFQPSDFARYALIMVLARSLHRDQDEVRVLWKKFMKYVCLVAVVVFLVAKEPDLGTAVLITLIAFLMFFFAEIRIGYLLSSGLALTAAGFAYIKLNPYMMDRVRDFVNVLFKRAPLPWQLAQSKIAFAVGHILGQGIGQSRSKYFFLPEAHKDFVFSVVGEETGLIGTVGVLLLFFIIVYRGIVIARCASAGDARLLVYGIISCIGAYALLNAAVTLGVVPTTGIPMPFISYGGSALVSHLVAVGLLINISSQSRRSFANYASQQTYMDRLNRADFKSRPNKRRNKAKTQASKRREWIISR